MRNPFIRACNQFLLKLGQVFETNVNEEQFSLKIQGQGISMF